MKPALIVNENFPVPALRKLREQGIDVLAVQEIMPGAAIDWVLGLLNDPAQALGQLVVISERTVRCRPLPANAP